MQVNQSIALILCCGAICLGMLSGCASQTTITSVPTGADVKIDGQPSGKTPYNYSEAQVWLWTKHQVTLEKSGYTATTGMLSGELSPTHLVVGILCCLPVALVGQYNPQYNFVLQRSGVGGKEVKEVWQTDLRDTPADVVKIDFAP